MLYSTLYKVPFAPDDRIKYPNVVRYYDLIQNIVNEKAPDAGLDFIEFDLNLEFVPRPAPVKEPKPPKQENEAKKAAKTEPASKEKAAKNEPTNKAKTEPANKEKSAKVTKNEQPSTENAKKIDPSKIDLRVGHILECEKHPDAESLYVEKVDVGEAEPRTVVSGLVKHMTLEEMIGARVVLVCNLKPAKMRGIESQAMVLCGTDAATGKVEFVIPPPQCAPGTKLFFETFTGNSQLKKANLKKY
jgi:aminoacyl tRNA synthase complex-interacting multifunctional protein 1